MGDALQPFAAAPAGLLASLGAPSSPAPTARGLGEAGHALPRPLATVPLVPPSLAPALARLAYTAPVAVARSAHLIDRLVGASSPLGQAPERMWSDIGFRGGPAARLARSPSQLITDLQDGQTAGSSLGRRPAPGQVRTGPPRRLEADLADFGVAGASRTQLGPAHAGGYPPAPARTTRHESHPTIAAETGAAPGPGASAPSARLRPDRIP